MTRTKWTRSTIAALALMGAAACGGTEPAVDELLLDDVALLAADATLEDVTLWSQPLAFAPAPAAPAAEPSLVPGEPGGHRGWSGDFSGTRSVTFYDEQGLVMDGYDELLTESIVIEHEIEGEVSRSGWSASIYRERSMTVSGLAGEETTRTWNGSGSEEVSRSSHLDDGTERSYVMMGEVAYEDVVVPVPGSDPRWPLSGSIRRSMTVTRSGPDGSVTRSVEIVITFNGTSIAMVTVNGEPMEIDLAARDGVNPVRRRDG